jgi:hypothetical protein
MKAAIDPNSDGAKSRKGQQLTGKRDLRIIERCRRTA